MSSGREGAEDICQSTAGYCIDTACRAKALERSGSTKKGRPQDLNSGRAERRAGSIRRQEAVAAELASSRGPLVEAASKMALRREKHMQRKEAVAAELGGVRGPLADATSKMGLRRDKHMQRKEEVAAELGGVRGPLADATSKMGLRRDKHMQRKEEVAAELGGVRGPLADATSKMGRRRDKHMQRKEEVAAELGGVRGPLADATSKMGRRRDKHMQRKEEVAAELGGVRGPLADAASKMGLRREKQMQRQEAVAAELGGARGPLAEAASKMGRRRDKHMQRKEEVAAELGGVRGPLADAASKMGLRREKQMQRQEAVAAELGGARGPLAEAASKMAVRREMQMQRKEAVAAEESGRRGPLRDEEGQRAIQKLRASMGKNQLKLGPPFDVVIENLERRQSILAVFKEFITDWARFGLSTICPQCLLLSTSRHCPDRQDAPSVCDRCRKPEAPARALPALPRVPGVLAELRYIERQLISTMKTSQHLISLPSGGPTGQWGRMYVTALAEPQLCEVMEHAEVGTDGTIHVKQPGTQQSSPARLEAVLAALRWLRDHNVHYKGAGVQNAIDSLTAKATPASSAVAAPEFEVDYLIDGAPSAPPASHVELRRARGSADMQADLDARAFPHLFPEGTGGIDSTRKFVDYTRARLLGADARFEQSPDYIYFLLEYWLKKKVAGNTNVRIGPVKQSKAKGASLRHAVYTTMRDIPGTQPYMYTRRSMAVNMFEQLGSPGWFLTLTCHAKQPSILLACIYAKLQRDRVAAQEAHVKEDMQATAAVLLHQYMRQDDFQWDGQTANQLCNSQPAIVSRQFFHQLRRFMRWLGGSKTKEEPDRQADAEADTDVPQPNAPFVLQEGTQEIGEVSPPFPVKDYIIRIEWQKRGYPHAHVLLWADSTSESRSDSTSNAAGTVQPPSAEQLCDEYICTTSPHEWMQGGLPVMEQLAGMVVHKCSAYCGRYTLGACRFGFPHRPEPQTRRKTGRELLASRSKSVFAVKRAADASMMGQYNAEMLLKWRGSMDLQLIADVGSASKYILGYTLKAEEDVTTSRRVEQLIHELATTGELNHQSVYKAAHTALQGRTTSTFEAAHLMLGLPVVQFSRGNVWVQVGPPSTWVLNVPKQDEALAIAYSDAYRHDPEHKPCMPLAQRRYADMQQNFPEEKTVLPVEGGSGRIIQWNCITFFDFCAGFDFRGNEHPESRQQPAIVGHRNYSPDLEPEEFYFSKLLLHMVWKHPGDWLQPRDGGSHAEAFRRIAADVLGYPEFLNSACYPHMDGTVAAARQLQKVQATMYIKSIISTAAVSVPSVEQERYSGALQIMQMLRQRHGSEIAREVPDSVPTGLAAEAHAPIEGGEEAFARLTDPEAPPDMLKQTRLMQYILRRIVDARPQALALGPGRLQLLVHGPGGCGKSFVLRAAAHKLRESGHGVVIAAYTGAAAYNVGGVTLHQCCGLPVTNRSYGQHTEDALAPQGAQLENLRLIWSHANVLFIDEISMVSAELFRLMDRNLKTARSRKDQPFGGVHVVAFGDLYQLPPPRNLPVYAALHLWKLFELCELEGNHRAASDPAWAQLLGRVRVGAWTEDDIRTLHSRVVGRAGGAKRNNNHRKDLFFLLHKSTPEACTLGPQPQPTGSPSDSHPSRTSEAERESYTPIRHKRRGCLRQCRLPRAPPYHQSRCRAPLSCSGHIHTIRSSLAARERLSET